MNFRKECETNMEKMEMLEGILNSYPYPIVFVDNEYIIRYMNKNATDENLWHFYFLRKILIIR